MTTTTNTARTITLQDTPALTPAEHQALTEACADLSPDQIETAIMFLAERTDAANLVAEILDHEDEDD